MKTLIILTIALIILTAILGWALVKGGIHENKDQEEDEHMHVPCDGCTLPTCWGCPFFKSIDGGETGTAV